MSEGDIIIRLGPPKLREGKPAVREWLWKRGHRECFVCKGSYGPMQIDNPGRRDYATIEHKIRRCDGGSNGIANLTLSHKRCNNGRERIEAKKAGATNVTKRERAVARRNEKRKKRIRQKTSIKKILRGDFWPDGAAFKQEELE